MLNLLRALLAIREDGRTSKGHGLSYRDGASLFECSAVTTAGTFVDYLDTQGLVTPTGAISLADCLRSIVEMARDVAASKLLSPTLVAPLLVHAKRSGAVELRFEDAFLDDLEFAADWESAFPELATLCSLLPHANVLTTTLKPDESGTGFVSVFCERYLIHDLRSLQHARWFVLRETPGRPRLPRLALYVAAMFILSSVCRYAPEKLAAALVVGSEAEWMLRRFLTTSDRFVPQLMLSLAYDERVLI
jgi:hypothetical protein